MLTTGVTVVLAEWIIDDTCLVFFTSKEDKLKLLLVTTLLCVPNFYGMPNDNMPNQRYCWDSFM